MEFSHLTADEVSAIDSIFVVEKEPKDVIIEDTKSKITSKPKVRKQRKGILATVKGVLKPKGGIINDFFDNL